MPPWNTSHSSRVSLLPGSLLQPLPQAGGSQASREGKLAIMYHQPPAKPSVYINLFEFHNNPRCRHLFYRWENGLREVKPLVLNSLSSSGVRLEPRSFRLQSQGSEVKLPIGRDGLG